MTILNITRITTITLMIKLIKCLTFNQVIIHTTIIQKSILIQKTYHRITQLSQSKIMTKSLTIILSKI